MRVSQLTSPQQSLVAVVITRLLFSIKKKGWKYSSQPAHVNGKTMEMQFFLLRKQGKLRSICGLFPAPKAQIVWNHRSHSLPHSKLLSVELLSWYLWPRPSQAEFTYWRKKVCEGGIYTQRLWFHTASCLRHRGCICVQSVFLTKVLPLPALLTNGFLAASFRKQATQKRNKSRCFHWHAARAGKGKKKPALFSVFRPLDGYRFQGCRNAH